MSDDPIIDLALFSRSDAIGLRELCQRRAHVDGETSLEIQDGPITWSIRMSTDAKRSCLIVANSLLQGSRLF